MQTHPLHVCGYYLALLPMDPFVGTSSADVVDIVTGLCNCHSNFNA
jgi:hypothetical protein